MVSLCSLTPVSPGQAQTHLPGAALLAVLLSFVSLLLASLARGFLRRILTQRLLHAINRVSVHGILPSVLGGHWPSNITAAYKAFAAAGSSDGSEHSGKPETAAVMIPVSCAALTAKRTRSTGTYSKYFLVWVVSELH